ncbi:hypothetical protein QQZ08_003971 [Neonectria magnoliae]|uniref:Carboxylic ester hydrolase n=1 Tax=Neonectria magnoliae TaxID=2732573 RepID=A0ABR1I8E4_9HYPO
MAKAASPAVQLDSCTVIGVSKPASEARPRALDVFFDIPYATAQRFERPEPVVLPEGIFDATEPGDGCPVLGAPGDEDCLRVNVTRPRPAQAAAGCPVLVYVHGGAFNFGHPLERDMERVVAWSREDIVGVSVAYRLGVLGFPGGEEACNLGLRDQAVALAWVGRWIAAFGGDGERMTVVGASAGAHSVGHHLLSPSPPPFHKAILESGSPTARSVLSPAHPRPAAQFAQLLHHAGCASLADLKAVPLPRLLDAAARVWARYETSVEWPFQPVVDGAAGVIPESPVRLWERRVADGRARGMCVVTGFCSHEGISFVPVAGDFRAFFTTLIPSLTPADFATLEALYPASQTTRFRRLAAAYGDFAYIAPVLHTAHVLSRAGARVYVYEYAEASAPYDAAMHGAQGPAMERDASVRADLAAAVHGRMTQFVSSPEGDMGDSWPAFVSPGGGEGRILVFGAAGGDGIVPVQERVLSEEEMRRMRFWWERMELVQGMGERVNKSEES